MSIYSSTGLVKAQMMINGAIGAQDKRYRSPESWLLFMRSSQSFLKDFASLRVRDDKADEANWFTRTSRALGTTITHNHTGTVGDTGVLTLNWGTYSDKFAKTTKQADGKIINADQVINNELENCFINFIEQLDDEASDFLVNNRSNINPAALNGAFDATNFVYEINATNYGTSAIAITKRVMDINKYQGVMMVISCDSIAFTEFERQAAQGAQNATNYAFQFNGVTFIHDPSLTAKAAAIDATYTKGFWMAIPDGTIGATQFIEPIYKRGEVTQVNRYGSLTNPIDGSQLGIHMYDTRADGTSKGGAPQDVVTEVQIYQEVAFVKAPLSTATETTIQAFAFV